MTADDIQRIDDDTVQIDDRPCPYCGHPETRWKECDAIGCDEGWVDLYDDDPINYAEGEEYEPCHECHGQGHQWRCPNCGADIWDTDDPDPARCHNCRAFGTLQDNGLDYICECGNEWSIDAPIEDVPLGVLRYTQRGFQLIEFHDLNGETCILQQSSRYADPPGTGAIWLGVETDRGKSSMHLNTDQVRELIQALQSWLETGYFNHEIRKEPGEPPCSI